ncbi:9845_t:CDS:2, partial [Diversispora eburnea]
DTRWNSYLTCCSITKFEPSQLNTCHRPNDPLTISQDIYSIIMNENFWKNLIKLEQLLISYCQILNILQTNKARLYEVLHGNLENSYYLFFLDFFIHFTEQNILHHHLHQELIIYIWKNGKKYTFDNETIHQFENNIYKYWYWIKDIYPKIGTVASRIFGICANAISVERLWSNMGFYHIKNRNKLK